MRAVVFAYHDVGFACLSELLAQRTDVALVITHEDDPGENVWWRPVAELCRRHAIPCVAPADVNTPEWIAKIRALAPDILFSFYYRRMICPAILGLAPRGALNMHGSLLPRYRGRAPINWVLVRGERETGATLHYMTDKPDAGDIVGQKRVAIEFEDTAFTLFHKVTAAAEDVLREALPALRRGTAPRVPQDLAKGNYVRGRRPADGLIDWAKPARAIYDLVRAVTHPYPGAFTFAGGRKLFVWEAHPVAGDAAGAAPGTVVVRETEGRTVHVATGDGLLRLERVQWEDAAEADALVIPAGTTFASG